jgi:hypothetical protein
VKYFISRDRGFLLPWREKVRMRGTNDTSHYFLRYPKYYVFMSL